MLHSFSRNLALSALAASCLLGCATDELEATSRIAEVPITPVELRPQLDEEGRPIPGTLDIDTSDGRMDLTHLIPERPREFRSWDHFHDWAVTDLNAELLVGDDGVRRTELSISAGPTVRYDAALEDMVEVEDVAEAVVGGTFGYVLIDGTLVCTSRTAECARDQMVDPAETPTLRWHLPNAKRVFKNGSELEGATWVTHLFFYHNVGSETRQLQGGFQTTTSPCGFLKWCTTTTGSNFLSTSLSAFRNGGSIHNFSFTQTRHNARSVRLDKIEWGPPSWGSQGLGLPPNGIIARTTGVCAWHHGNDASAVIDIKTADGQHPSTGC